jgi:CheY-like chemotaxis protein
MSENTTKSENLTIKPNILVVDDIVDNIDVVKGILSSEYKLRAATNGERALRIAHSDNPPDLILLDIMMPGIDGLEVCRQLKADEKTSDISIIFLSALGEDKDVVKGLSLGAADYVSKPVKPEILLARVATQLSLKAGRDALRRELDLQQKHSALQQDVERMMHHDLKNPLGVILGFSEFFSAEYNLDEEQREIIGHIESASLNMLDQINNSLNLYKIEQGVYQVQAKELDFLPLINRCITEQKALANSRKVEIVLHCQTQKIMIFAEELLSLSMLGNLLKNAVEASSKEQTVNISLTTDSVLTPNKVIIKIHNPTEVPEALKLNFFERYTTSGKQQGTGIGTYSAKLLCEVQKGQIEMSSDAEHGTTITLSLPKS